MRQRNHHSLGVISLVSVNAPTEVSDLTVKETFYTMLKSMVDECPRRDTILVLGDFNAMIVTDRNCCETYVRPRGSGTVNQNSTKFRDFARSLGLVHGFSTHRLIAGLGIPLLVVWQRRLTMCSFMGNGG